jgi:alpha-1,6-mannosyltransferase
MGLTSLHVTNAYHPSSGGIRTFYTALLDAANRQRRMVRLVVPGPETRVENVGQFGRIYFVRAPFAPAFDRRYRLILPWRFMPVLHGPLISILERERPSVVEICDKYSLPYLAAMLRKRWHRGVPRPFLVGLTCERFDDNMAAFCSSSRAAQAFTRWYIRHIYGPPFDSHVANSEYTAGELRTALRDRPPGFIHVAPMGVQADEFGPEQRSAGLRDSLLHRAGGSEHSTLLLYAGRISPEKNIELLIDTLRLLTADGEGDYRLVLAGDGPSCERVRHLARELSLSERIVLCGNLDRQTLASFYASADVFVHPNAREPFGIGPLEAMASGVPVVMPAAGGVLEYGSTGNAWLAEPTAPAFADAVRAAHRGDPERLLAARETARRYRWREVTRRYFELYDDLYESWAATSRPTRLPRLDAHVIRE